MKAARLHVIYSLLLAHCFSLADEDAATAARYWGGGAIEGSLIEWPYKSLREEWRRPQRVKVCSMPSQLEQLHAAEELSAHFNLEGVPGFYRDDDPIPGPASSRDLLDEFGPWRIHLPYREGLLVPYTDTGAHSGLIVGIRIYLLTPVRRAATSTSLRAPFVLSSRGLPSGARAVAYREAAA